MERVDLCSMLKKKQEDGYYHTETSLQLGEYNHYLAVRGRQIFIKVSPYQFGYVVLCFWSQNGTSV